MKQEANDVGGVIGLILLIIIGVVLFNVLKPPVWSGIYTTSLGTSAKYQDFSDKDACAGWISSQRFGSDTSQRECGKNCKPPTTTMGAYVCEETFD